MRLRRAEIDAFRVVLASRIRRQPAKLYLFGSRARNKSKGGDIDLLVIGPAPLIRRLRGAKHSILADFKRAVGDQRIDLVLTDAAKARQDPFLRHSLKDAVLLKRWAPRPARTM